MATPEMFHSTSSLVHKGQNISTYRGCPVIVPEEQFVAEDQEAVSWLPALILWYRYAEFVSFVETEIVRQDRHCHGHCDTE